MWVEANMDLVGRLYDEVRNKGNVDNAHFRFGDSEVIGLLNHHDDLGLIQQLGAPFHAGSGRLAAGEK